MKRMMTATVMMAAVMVMAAGTARGAEPEEFTGDWLNIDSNSTHIKRIEIGIFKTVFTVHTWSKCTPVDCDWGTLNVPIPPGLEDSFTAQYIFADYTRTLTITRISANSLHVHQFVDFTPEDGRTDYETDDYFHRQGSGTPKPDLIVAGLTIPAPVVVSGPGPDAVVTMTIRNLGPGIVPVGTTRAEFRGCTRNGEPFDKDGFFPIASTQPLYPGQTQTFQFSVGNLLLWPVGVYSIRIKADSQEAVEEADERNNLSPKLAFDIAEERFLSGTILFNGQPLTNYTDLAPLPMHVYYVDTGDIVDGVFFWYDPQTSHYLFSGLPNAYVRLFFRFFQSGDGMVPTPHDYWTTPELKMTEISSEQARDYDVRIATLIHLLEPWDNAKEQTIMSLCPGTEFSWEPVEGTDHYHVLVKRGGGDDTTVLSIDTTETSLRPDVEPSAAGEYYYLMIFAYHASGERLASLIQAWNHTYGSFNFKVCPICVRGDINRDCRVNMLDLAELAEHWLVDTR